MKKVQPPRSGAEVLPLHRLQQRHAHATPTLSDETAICILACAASINQHLYRLIELLNEQTRVLKRLLGKRPRPTMNERRALAVLAHDIDRRVLAAQELIFITDTFPRWHRRLIANTFTASGEGGRGSPPRSRR